MRALSWAAADRSCHVEKPELLWLKDVDAADPASAKQFQLRFSAKCVEPVALR